MKKICAVCDVDEQYVNRLINYSNEKKIMPYDLVMFTKVDLLLEYLKDEYLEVLMISEKMEISQINMENIGIVVYLAEEETARTGYIYKYQSADTILKLVALMCRGEQEGDKELEKVGITITGVYSPVGRSYKTTLSLALSTCISKNKKILYINLEEFCGLPQMTGENNGSLSDLIYYYRHNQKKFREKIPEIITTLNGFDYIPVCSSPEDYEEVSTNEWIGFIEFIASMGEYEEIVLDIGNVVHESWKMISICNKVYMPLSRDEVGKNKENRFMDYMKQLGKYEILGKIVTVEIPYDSELAEKCNLEYIEWSSVGEGAKQLIYGQFNGRS